MMLKPSDEDIILIDSLDEWFVIDKDGNCVLREDTPDKLKKAHEMLKKKYRWIES